MTDIGKGAPTGRRLSETFVKQDGTAGATKALWSCIRSRLETLALLPMTCTALEDGVYLDCSWCGTGTLVAADVPVVEAVATFLAAHRHPQVPRPRSH